MLANHATQTLANLDCGGGEDKPCPKGSSGSRDSSSSSSYGSGSGSDGKETGMYATIEKLNPK